MSSSVTWDQTVVSRTAVRGERCRFAKWRTVSGCHTTAYDAVALYDHTRRCPNGIDRRPCAHAARLPFTDRRPPILDSKHSALASQHSAVCARHPVVAAWHPVVAAKIKAPNFEKSTHPFDASGSRFEASIRQTEAFGGQLGVFRRQPEALKCGIRSLRWAIRGFRSPAQTDDTMALVDRSAVCSARTMRSRPEKTNQVRELAGGLFQKLGRSVLRPFTSVRHSRAGVIGGSRSLRVAAARPTTSVPHHRRADDSCGTRRRV